MALTEIGISWKQIHNWSSQRVEQLSGLGIGRIQHISEVYESWFALSVARASGCPPASVLTSSLSLFGSLPASQIAHPLLNVLFLFFFDSIHVFSLVCFLTFGSNLWASPCLLSISFSPFFPFTSFLIFFLLSRFQWERNFSGQSVAIFPFSYQASDLSVDCLPMAQVLPPFPISFGSLIEKAWRSGRKYWAQKTRAVLGACLSLLINKSSAIIQSRDQWNWPSSSILFL